MTPEMIRAIRTAAGLTQTDLAALLRMGGAARRTVRRWETDEQPITGPASILLELLAAGELPARYFTDAGLVFPRNAPQEPREARTEPIADAEHGGPGRWRAVLREHGSRAVIWRGDETHATQSAAVAEARETANVQALARLAYEPGGGAAPIGGGEVHWHRGDGLAACGLAPRPSRRVAAKGAEITCRACLKMFEAQTVRVEE